VLIAEAKWIGAALAALPDDAFPLAHVGCQTEEFRTVVQPWVDEFVFAPLRARGRTVVHVDIRKAPGVDLIADVTTAAGQEAIRDTGARTLLCANLLEHVPDAQHVLDDLLAIVPAGGHLLVSGPLVFPYHPDPIDTMFRPTWEEMSRRVGPDWAVVAGENIVDHRLAYYDSMRPRGRLRIAGRVALPFLRPKGWLTRVRDLATRTSCYALLVRRR
jgi:hypothetical protein